MEFWIQKDNDSKINLPVKPSEYQLSVKNKNTVVNVIQLGDINLMGKTGLSEISFNSFFPSQSYNFSNTFITRDPFTYIDKIEEWRLAGEPVRVIITGVLNMECTIESFVYGEQDGTGDVYYTLDLKEYKKVAVKRNTTTKTKKTSTRTVKSTKSNSGREYSFKAGDCLWKIAKLMYGNGGDYTRILKANATKIINPNKIPIGTVIKIP